MQVKLNNQGGWLFLLTFFLFMLVPLVVFAEKNVVINEIFPNPRGSDRGKEFVELYNSSDEKVELNGWILRKISEKGKIKEVKFDENDNIKPKEYLKVTFSGLNNDGATVELINSYGNKVGDEKYGNVVEGQSYNRDEKKIDNDWYWAEESGGEKNMGNPINKKYPKLILSEILANPSGDEKSREFIEIYNPGDKTVSLKGWQLQDSTASGVYTLTEGGEIKADGYFVVYRSKFKFALNNSGEEKVKLIAPNNKIKDEVELGDRGEDISYNYNLAEQRWWGSKFLTPGKVNKFNYLPTFVVEVADNIYEGNETIFSVSEVEDINGDQVRVTWDFGDGHRSYKFLAKHKYKTAGHYVVVLLVDDGIDKVERKYDIEVKKEILIEGVENEIYPQVIVSEILPNPRGVEKEKEFIELYNPGSEIVNLKNWELKDGSRAGRYIFAEDVEIEGGGHFVIFRKDFKFALNNSGGEVVELVAPSGVIVSKVEYKSAKESLSYNYHLEDKSWRWSKTLTPGVKNIFNNLPTFKLDQPKKVYKNIYAEFELHKLKDKDSDEIKIIWDFGDGHKSYLKKTRHKYKKTGKYTVKLIVKDDSEEVIKEFKIKVKKYPQYKLKIIGIMPNPNGKDKGKEIVLIKNLESKKVDLTNYKIGTGKNKDKIVEHPFYGKVKIKPGEIKKIINDDSCKFSLLNDGGVVQILNPNGKIADEIKYAKKKIFPNEMYKLDEKQGRWYWEEGAYITSRGQSKHEGIEVLGAKMGVNVDITLDSVLGLCKTSEQIKRDNWVDNWVNKWLF